jgi:hypothetical protein
MGQGEREEEEISEPTPDSRPRTIYQKYGRREEEPDLAFIDEIGPEEEGRLAPGPRILLRAIRRYRALRADKGF